MLRTQRVVWRGSAMAFMLISLLLAGFSGIGRGEELSSNGSNPLKLLENERLLLGMVEEIRAQEVRVDTGDLMPRYVSLRQAGDKHRTSPCVGDMLLLIVNDQNNVIQYHLYGEEEWHALVNGKLVKPIPNDQYWALVQFQSGKVKTIPIDAAV